MFDLVSSPVRGASLVLGGTVPILVTLAILAWRGPKHRQLAPLLAFVVACVGAGIALLRVLAEHRTAEYVSRAADASSWEALSMLEEGYAEARPTAIAGAMLILVVLPWCLAAWKSRKARLSTAVAAAALVVPLVWLGTRGIGLRERFLRDAVAKIEPRTHEGCASLESIAGEVGGVDGVARYDPEARALAHDCVAMYFGMLDHDGPEKEKLEKLADLMGRVHPSQGGRTPYDWLGHSRLLVDPAQRAELERRRAEVAAAQ